MAQYAIWQQNKPFSARQDRGLVEALFTEGVLDPGAGGLAVSERAAGANMSLDVALGRCVVDGDDQADQRSYLCFFEDSSNLAVAAADAQQARIDRVIVRVRDSAVSGSDDLPLVEVLAGVPGEGMPAPEPPSSITLATVYVGANAVSITDADITDERLRAAAGGLSEDAADALYEPLDAAAAADASASPTVDFAGGPRLVRLTASGSVDISFGGVPSSADTVRSVTLVIDGADSVAWPVSTVFPGGEPPDVVSVTWLVCVAWSGEVAVFVSGSEVA